MVVVRYSLHFSGGWLQVKNVFFSVQNAVSGYSKPQEVFLGRWEARFQRLIACAAASAGLLRICKGGTCEDLTPPAARHRQGAQVFCSGREHASPWLPATECRLRKEVLPMCAPLFPEATAEAPRNARFNMGETPLHYRPSLRQTSPFFRGPFRPCLQTPFTPHHHAAVPVLRITCVSPAIRRAQRSERCASGGFLHRCAAHNKKERWRGEDYISAPRVGCSRNRA